MLNVKFRSILETEKNRGCICSQESWKRQVSRGPSRVNYLALPPYTLLRLPIPWKLEGHSLRVVNFHAGIANWRACTCNRCTGYAFGNICLHPPCTRVARSTMVAVIKRIVEFENRVPRHYNSPTLSLFYSFIVSQRSTRVVIVTNIYRNFIFPQLAIGTSERSSPSRSSFR